MPYGCFVEFMAGKEGLLHISEISWKRLESVEEAGLKEGDNITVKLLEIDPKTGKYRLSMKALQPRPEGYVEPERRERREPRNDRGDRRNNNNRREFRGERRDNREEGQNND
jgi:polyribonucleotide nucleotidyltransferase